MSGELLLRTFVDVSGVVRHGLGLRRLHGGIRRPNRFRIRPIRVMLLVFFATFKELRLRGASLSLGEVSPADAFSLLKGMPGQNIFV